VDTAWLCTLASLTIPCVYADKVKDVPVTSVDAKARLTTNPTLGKHLIALWSEEARAQHKVRVQAGVGAPPPAAPPAFVPLTWDDSDAEPAPEVAADPAAEVVSLERSIQDLGVPEGKSGAAPSRKCLRAFVADLDTVTALYAEKYNTLGATNADRSGSHTVPRGQAARQAPAEDACEPARLSSCRCRQPIGLTIASRPQVVT